MGWNGSGGGSTPIKPNGKYPPSEASFAKQSGYRGAKKPSPVRGLVAGLVVVGLAAGAYFAFFSGAEKPQDEKTAEKERGLIKEVKPAAAPKYAEKVEKAEKPKKAEKPIWERPMPAGLDEGQQQVWKNRCYYEKKLATDKRLQKFLANAKPTKSTFNSGVDQVLDWIFSCKVGDGVPPPLPQMGEIERNHLDVLLDSVNEIKDDDSPEIAERKKMVDEVKKELKKYLDEGGKMQDFMQHYYNELVQARALKTEARVQINKMIDENPNDPGVALEFTEKTNALLENRGITPVELTEDQKEEIAERLNENDKK